MGMAEAWVTQSGYRTKYGSWHMASTEVVSSFLFGDWKEKRLGKEGRDEGGSKPTYLPAYLTCKSTSALLSLFQVFLYVQLASLTCVSSQTQLSALPSGRSFCRKPSDIFRHQKL